MKCFFFFQSYLWSSSQGGNEFRKEPPGERQAPTSTSRFPGKVQSSRRMVSSLHCGRDSHLLKKSQPHYLSRNVYRIPVRPSIDDPVRARNSPCAAKINNQQLLTMFLIPMVHRLSSKLQKLRWQLTATAASARQLVPPLSFRPAALSAFTCPLQWSAFCVQVTASVAKSREP